MKFFALFLFLIISAQAAEVIAEDRYSNGSSIRILVPFSVLPSNGFASLRVEMENKGSDTLTWDFEITASKSQGYRIVGSDPSGSIITTKLSATCSSGEKRVTEFLVPVFPKGINGYSGTGTLGVEFSKRSSPQDGGYGMFEKGTVSQASNILFSSKIPGKLDHDIHRYLSERFQIGYRSGARGSLFGSFETEDLPQDWRAYAGYDGMVFTKEDYLSLNSSAGKAIRQWVQNGGVVFVLGGDSLLPIGDLTKEEVAHGFGLFKMIDSGGEVSEARGYTKVDEIRFGRLNSDVAYRIYKTIEDDSIIQTQSLSGDYSSIQWKLGKSLGSRSLQTGLVLLVLIIFAIIVGPVNLFIWADKTRRHRLFFTTPLISLVASLLLIAFIVFRDGFGGDGARAIAIDVGGPGDNSAAILQEQFSRSGILFSSSFELDDNSVAHPVPAPVTEYNLADSRSANGLVSYEADRTSDGWKFTGDWFESRTEQAQTLRSVIPSRERLQLIATADGAPRLVSSFSYSLEKIYYRDSESKVWTASSIAPGETVALTLARKEDAKASVMPVIELFGSSRQTQLKRTIKRPGSFTALATGAPAIATLSSIDWKKSPALITGLLK